MHQLSHERDIAAGTKRTTGTRNDHDPYAAITSGMFESFRQIAPHVTDEGVELLGTIQSDRQDAFGFSDEDVFVHVHY